MSEDVAKSVPPGVARGVAGVIGLPALLERAWITSRRLQQVALYSRYFGSGQWEDTEAMKQRAADYDRRAQLPRPGATICSSPRFWMSFTESKRLLARCTSRRPVPEPVC